MFRGGVDEVPIVDAVEVLDVDGKDAVAVGLRALLIPLVQEQQRQQALRVDPGAQQSRDRRVIRRMEAADQRAGLGDSQAEEDVAFPVLARAGLEEALEHGGPFRVGERLHGVPDLRNLRHERVANQQTRWYAKPLSAGGAPASLSSRWRSTGDCLFRKPAMRGQFSASAPNSGVG